MNLNRKTNGICVLTTVHPAFDVRIFHKEIKSLVLAGYNVTLIAQHDCDEIVDGVKIVALPRTRSRFIRMFSLTWKALRFALRERAVVYHFHDPELIPTGLFLRAMGKKVIYDVHEDVPRQIESKFWIHKRLRVVVSKVVELIEAIATRFLNGVVAATPKIAKRFPKEKTVLVQNFPMLSEFVRTAEIPYAQRPPWVVYIGGISVTRGVREMLKAMEMLPGELGARLVLAGRFSSTSLNDEFHRFPGWTHVDFLGWLQREEVAEVLSKARVGLVVLHPEPSYIESLPIKLFEYMSAGIPVVASDFPLWREIIEREGCGLLVNPLDPQDIAQAIHWVLTHPREAEEMGRRGRQAVEKRYNWTAEAVKLLALYGRLLG